MASTTFHIPDQLLSEIDRAARERGLSRNRFVLQACGEALARGSGEWPAGFFDPLSSREDDRLLAEAARELEKAGLPDGSGPHKVITNMAILGYDSDTKRMQVESIHQGFKFEDVQQNCGFPLLKAKNIVETPPPTERELELLRKEVDPEGYIISKG